MTSKTVHQAEQSSKQSNLALITLSGLDGSGKSAQAQMLQDRLAKTGKRVFYFHAVQFGIAQKMRRRVTTQKNDAEKAITHASWCAIQLRKCALLLDLLRFRFLLRKLRKENCDALVSDRYFYDTVINILFLQKKGGRLFAERFIPNPTHAFFLAVPPEEIMKRARVPEQGIAYLTEKESLFRDKIKTWPLRIVDGNRPRHIVAEDIFRLPTVS